MNNYEILFLRSAGRELEKITDNLSLFAGSKAANRIVKNILERIKALKENPYLGKSCDDIMTNDEEYRRIVIKGKYLCFYRVVDSKIYIYHIVNGKRDYSKLFNL